MSRTAECGPIDEPIRQDNTAARGPIDEPIRQDNTAARGPITSPIRQDNSQLNLETLKSTINYELYRDLDKIQKLGCQQSVHFITKNFAHVRNDIKNAVNKINLLFDSNGYFPLSTIVLDKSGEYIRQSNTKYNVYIQWPAAAQNNRTNICTIKGYFYYSTNREPVIIRNAVVPVQSNNGHPHRRDIAICLTIQLGVFYDLDFVLNEPNIQEYITSTLFIDKRPKLYDDMVCNINRMMIQPKHNKIPSYLRNIIHELHMLFEISDKL